MATLDGALAVQDTIGVSAVLLAEVRTVAELADSDWAQEQGAFVSEDIGGPGFIAATQRDEPTTIRLRSAATGLSRDSHSKASLAARRENKQQPPAIHAGISPQDTANVDASTVGGGVDVRQ